MGLNNTGQNVLKHFPFAVGKRSDDPVECSPYGRAQSSSDLEPASCQRQSRQAFARAKLCLDKPAGGRMPMSYKRLSPPQPVDRRLRYPQASARGLRSRVICAIN